MTLMTLLFGCFGWCGLLNLLLAWWVICAFVFVCGNAAVHDLFFC